MGKFKTVITHLFCLPIKLYQYGLSPILPNCRRFYPSCSQYTLESIQQLGICKGSMKAFKRLLRCHPWSCGGYDPVQPTNEKL